MAYCHLQSHEAACPPLERHAFVIGTEGVVRTLIGVVK